MGTRARERMGLGSNRRLWPALALAGLIPVWSCSGATGTTEDVGEARVALSQAPTDVGCIEITARGVRQVVKRFDVTAGASAAFEMVGLPVGDVQFSATTFQEACAVSSSTSIPTWVGDPVVAAIVPRVIAQVLLVLHRNGRGSIALDFRDCAEGLVDLGGITSASDINAVDMNEIGQVTGSTGTDTFVWRAGTMLGLGLGAGSSVVAINNAGQILAHDPQGWPVVWDQAVVLRVAALSADWSNATAMNDKTQVVGRSTTPTGESHAFLWQPGAGAIDLGTLGGTFSNASAINTAGQVVGDSDTPSETHAFIWEAGAMRDLGNLGGGWSSAAAINDAGQVVGSSSIATGESHAFSWKDGVMLDLGTLGGDWSNAATVSSTGQVVGQSNLTAGGSDAHVFLWDAGQMRDLGTLGGSFSALGSRRAINDAGEVAGSSEIALGETHAFVWRAGTMHDLGTLGVPATYAQGINNAHQVFGNSTTNSGRQRGFFFDPGKCPLGDAPDGGP